MEQPTTAGSIDSFIRHSQELTPLLSAEGGGEAEGGWEESLAPGQQISDYLHDPTLPIPLPPPPSYSYQDMGRTPNSLLEYTPPTPKDVEDLSADWGVCGLLNMGNTCYMNAGLQCIRSIPAVARYYLDSQIPVSVLPQVSTDDQGEKPDKHLACKGHLSLRFSTLVQKLWSRKFSALHPKAFKTTLGVLHPQFADNRQQDCQEFLAMLLDTLHDDYGYTPPPQLTNGEAMEVEPANQNAASTESHDPKVDGECWHNKTSIVTETFQGMLRNEVLCHKCGHLSTKREPFVYLSVSLPHAFERQIEIRWVPVCTESKERRVIKCLVTVSKHGTVGEAKDALLYLIGQQLSRDLVVLAEVKEKSIVRVVPDTLPLKHLDNTNNTVYAFEMAPLGAGVSLQQDTEEDTPTPTPQDVGYMPLGSEDAQGEGVQQNGGAFSMQEEVQDPWMPVGGHPPFLVEGNFENLDPFGSEQFSGGQGCVLAGKHGKESDSEMEGEGLPAKMRRRSEDGFTTELFQNMEQAMDCDATTSDSHAHGSLSSAPNSESTPAITPVNAVSSGPAPQAVVMEWRTCSICLDEMVDSDLLTHKDCGAIVCRGCLQASTEHYCQEGNLMPCPICSSFINPSTAFTPLTTLDSSQSIIRLLQTNVIFRVEGEGVELFGHPAVMNLPSSDKGAAFYSALSPLLPPTTSGLPWKLHLTDAKGRFCSRCRFGSGCHGCEIANCEVTLDLKPGDHIAVSFNTLPEGVARVAGEVEDHSSLNLRRQGSLTLEECLEAFSQREVLGSDNPWFCPQCRENQEAMRTLAVCSLPHTLVVHLKRFVYHGNAGSKVDVGVEFPLELDPRLVCPEASPALLQLTACVCHFGTMNCGHYTSYSRHPTTGEWWYYNDEKATKAEPSSKDAESVYILFYQQKAAAPPTLPEVKGQFDDAAEMKTVEHLLRLFKPPLSSRPLPPLPLKRSNSETNLTAPSSGDLASGLAVLSALGLETSGSSKPLVRSSSNPQLAPSLHPTPGRILFTSPDSDASSMTGGVRLLSVKMTPW